jgi:peroxiredoxin
MNIRRAAALFATMLFVAAAAKAQVAGEAAPDFTLTDADGKSVHLADFRGKLVVLEWTNPECPFVRKHYDSRNMQGLQKESSAKDVVWLTINSTRRSHYEYKTPAEMSAWMHARDGAPRAVLVDADSATARAYAARTTPHMFVIDPAGRIVYAGAIDDRRSTRAEDASAAHNYVRAALSEVQAGRPVSLASTTPYGCSIKY